MGDEPTGPIRRIGAMSAAAAPFDHQPEAVKPSSVIADICLAVGMVVVTLGWIAVVGLGVYALARLVIG